MTEAQRDQYFNGEIDSLGKSLVANAPATQEDEGEFEDLGMGSPAPTSTITEGELRDKLKAYANIHGAEEAYKVLAHFGAKRIKDIDSSKYGEVAAELE